MLQIENILIKPKKSLGQNFLIDKNICKKIINLTKIRNNNILEIGPGTGSLTEEILKNNPKKLTIIEKDENLFKQLKNKFNQIKNLEIINDDALNYDYYKIPNQTKIISNLPYNISIKLIINWIKINNKFDELILMIQKEVADKMNYQNKQKKNRLNFFINITSQYKIKFDVSRNVFFPKPKIQSSVVQIKPFKNIKINLDNLENFTKEIFKYKRKKLSNVLKSNKNYTIGISNNLLEKRAEDLKFDELLNIFKSYYD